MRFTIAGKIITMIIVAVIFSCAAIFMLVVNLLGPPLEASLNVNIQRVRGAIAEIYRGDEQKFFISAKLVAEKVDLVAAVVANDHAKAKELGKQLMQITGAEFITITDAQGIVVARGHSDQYGDDVNNQSTVTSARKGESTVGVVQGTVMPYTVRAGAPIMAEGKVVGTVGLGVSIATEAYVDRLKDASAGVEITLFRGDTRAMTTIIRDGKRATGTKLDAPVILKDVLTDGKTYYGDLKVLGINHKVAYWPIMGSDNKPIGMWFAGASLEKVEEVHREAIFKSILAVIGVTLLFAILALIVGKKLAAPIRKIAAFAVSVSEGDLDADLDIRSKDETRVLATALHSMVANLKERITESQQQSTLAALETEKARQATMEADEARTQAENAKREGLLEAAGKLEGITNAVLDVSNRLSDMIAQCEQGAAEQASRVSETAIAMEEMNSTVIEVARNAAAANNMSNDAHEQAKDGALIVNKAVGGMQLVLQDSLALKADMSALSEQAQSINQIMGVISDIADQTNLLALNAAIEAARAGEAGRGFAVVADEVRKLAEKTMLSTADVAEAIKGIQAGTAKSMTQVDQTVVRIEDVSTNANQSGVALKDIVGIVVQTSDQISAIAAASEEQSASSEEINISISHINELSGKTSTIMGEAACAVDELAKQTQVLSDLIEQLKNA